MTSNFQYSHHVVYYIFLKKKLKLLQTSWKRFLMNLLKILIIEKKIKKFLEKSRSSCSNLTAIINTQLTTPCEVVKIIKALKSSKSPGPDHITNLVPKNLPKKTICYLAKNFNVALKLEYFPICWRQTACLV